MTEEEYRKALKKVSKAYATAETEIKALEIYSGELSIPAINELRYAGRHILNAADSVNKDYSIAVNEIKLAKDHCIKAFNDISDASIVFFLEEIRDFENTYGASLYEVLENYKETRKKVYAAQLFIIENRRKFKDHPKFYKKSRRYSEDLKAVFEQLYANKELLEKARYKIEAQKLEERRRFGLTVAISLITIALAMVGIVIKIFFY